MASPCQNPTKGQSCMQIQAYLKSSRRMRLMLQDQGSCQLPQCERRKSQRCKCLQQRLPTFDQSISNTTGSDSVLACLVGLSWSLSRNACDDSLRLSWPMPGTTFTVTSGPTESDRVGSA